MKREKVITQNQINKAIERLATEINKEYKQPCNALGQELLFVINLKGALLFGADLYRRITLDNVNLDFVQTSSYKNGTEAGELEIIRGVDSIRADFSNSHVLLVDDIVDTGEAMAKLYDEFKPKNPRSIKVCALIDKIKLRHITSFTTPIVYPDFWGIKWKDEYLVGYGLAQGEKERRLPDIYRLIND